MIFPPLLAFPLIRAGKRISSTRTDTDTCDVRRGGTRLKVCFKLITKFPLSLLQLFLVYACTIPYFLARHSATPHTFDLQLAMLWGSWGMDGEPPRLSGLYGLSGLAGLPVKLNRVERHVWCVMTFMMDSPKFLSRKFLSLLSRQKSKAVKRT